MIRELRRRKVRHRTLPPPNFPLKLEELAILRSAASLHDLAAKVLPVAKTSEFRNFIPHLRLISRTSVQRASLLNPESKMTFIAPAWKAPLIEPPPNTKALLMPAIGNLSGYIKKGIYIN